jgi:Adaptive response protein AidB N-terminal domain
MTVAAVPSLRIQPELAAEWESRVLSNEYDPRLIRANEKRGALFGMAMTETAGWFGRPCQHYTRAPACETRPRRSISKYRSQMVLRSANVRRVSGTGTS